MTENKILSTAVSNGQTERTYAEYEVAYDSSDDLAEIITVIEEDEDGNASELPIAQAETTLTEWLDAALAQSDETNRTYQESDGTTVTFKRVVLVGSETSRDKVEAELADAGIHYESGPTDLTEKEKQIIEREGANNSKEALEVLQKRGTLLDRELVNDETKAPIAQAIQQMKSQDPELAGALDNVFEVMTGETSKEVSERMPNKF